MLKPICLVAALGLLLPRSAPAQSHTPYQQLGREIYRELIETDTTHSSGDTTKAAELLARRFRAAGFPDEDIRMVGPEQTNQNLVVRYRGKGVKDPVILLAHLDVVEAKREDWSFDPFKLTEKDGYFYGRGTADDKDGVATLTAALIRLRQEGFKPNRDLILALTAGEEGGSAYNGVEWLLTNRHELVRGSLCLNADSGGVEMKGGRKLLYAVQAAEKLYQTYRLEAKGKGGHSSVPTPENPIYWLAAGLLRIAQHQFPAQLNDVTRGYFAQMSRIESGPEAAAMAAVAQVPPDENAIRELSKDPYYNALLRTTAVATMIEGGHQENALPQSARAMVNCRLLPGESPDELLRALKTIVADERISITPVEPAKVSPASPLTPEVQGALERAVRSVWPTLAIVPEMETGATDSLHFRRLGVPSYGISGTASDVDDLRIHGKDERMEVEDFYNALEFEYQLLKAICSEAR